MLRSGDLVDRLRRLVTELAPTGASLPGEYALAERFGTSRPAVREAIVALEREGLLRRRAGAPTAINPVAVGLRHRFDEQLEFTETLRRAGYEARVEVLEAGWVPVAGPPAGHLEVEPGTAAYRTVKRWYADEVVAMVAVDVIPAAADAVGRSLDPQQSLFSLVEALTGDVVDWEVAWPDAGRLDRVTARWMRRRVGTPVLTMELVGVGRRGRPRYHALEHHRPGVVRFGLVRNVG